ncbi:hypothetical protein ACM39_07545 [Chryseobacterium sp. FH2]|uniref:hypothetical protein n=1 Tax=Chryseobacterium sp. FH2 TaxID=1674291 RepID=UPI00065AEED5|nr:hypothetical protein [Chryseobacterium sp. FH2]KMQ68366.1 hypothetical protein ACM39_07545 [Chryseobacterium sp. FH2]
MATYESIIKIKGTVGDLVFYNLNGKNIVRKKSGFNKNAFKKSPSYEKVRQNSSEFGHCSKVGKMIRKALEKFIKESNDPLLYQKFAKVMTEIKDLDATSERGKRTVKNGLGTKNGKTILNNFQFGNKLNLENVVSISSDLESLSLKFCKETSVDNIILITLKLDFENYLSEKYEESISLKEKDELIFKKYFNNENLLLHFVVLKKDQKITHMGFI